MAEGDAESRDAASRAQQKSAPTGAKKVGRSALAIWRERLTEWEPITEFCLAVVAVIVLALTMFQAWVTNRQLTAMIDSNKLATESAEREQRAYVVALTNDRPLLSYSPSNGEYKFEIKVKNSGGTPAHHAVTRMKIHHLLESDRRGPGDERGDADPPISIGPDQEFSLMDVGGLDDRGKKFQADGSRVFWVVGEVKYDDVFNNRRFTKFRFRQGPSTPDSTAELQKFEMAILEVLSD